MKNVVRFFIMIILFCFLISCETTDNFSGQSIDKESLRLIEQAEVLLLKYKFLKERDYFRNASSLIAKLDKLAENNKSFEAKVLGLHGMAALFQNNIPEVSDTILEIEKRNKSEEFLYFLKAEIEKDKNEQKNIILTGMKKSVTISRLKLLLAENYFFSGKYNRAVESYDDAFAFLPGEYKAYYKKNRDLAFSLINFPLKEADNIVVLLKDRVSIKEVLEVFLSETAFLSKLSEGSDLSVRRAYDILKDREFLFNGGRKVLGFFEDIKKKDLAYLLLRLISDSEQDTTLLDKYNANVVYGVVNENASPISDVSMRDYYYNAVLVLVEREIMELPDGKSFFPEEYVSGLMLYEILIKLKKLY